MAGIEVISGVPSTDKPMFDGASLALGVLVGFYGATNSGKCTININDGATGELMWKYEKTLSRSLGSDTNTVINTIMRKASRQLPYIEGERMIRDGGVERRVADPIDKTSVPYLPLSQQIPLRRLVFRA